MHYLLARVGYLALVAQFQPLPQYKLIAVLTKAVTYLQRVYNRHLR